MIMSDLIKNRRTLPLNTHFKEMWYSTVMRRIYLALEDCRLPILEKYCAYFASTIVHYSPIDRPIFLGLTRILCGHNWKELRTIRTCRTTEDRSTSLTYYTYSNILLLPGAPSQNSRSKPLSWRMIVHVDAALVSSQEKTTMTSG